MILSHLSSLLTSILSMELASRSSATILTDADKDEERNIYTVWQLHFISLFSSHIAISTISYMILQK